MKRIFRLFLWLVLLFMPFYGEAQLRVALRLEHASVLQFEPIIAFVTIYNDSNQSFFISGDRKGGASSVEFIIEKRRDEPAARINDRPLVTKFRVPPGEKREIMLNPSLWYDIGTMGRYLVRSVVSWKGKKFESSKVMIDVVHGIEIKSVLRNVPGHFNLVRKYSLLYWTRGRREYLFLRVDDRDEGSNYGVFQLGPLIRVFKPELDVDKSGTIRIQHQSGTDCYIRSVFKSSGTGVRAVSQSYHLANGEPYPFLVPEL